ncbi:Hypothetical predicted protein [Mytilus galloprovincialis]|uniref:Coactosin-like protein n=1 Tax=Mytilus galloprovincialis TaxID=29158 RepID=A0A8B6CD34_MYTGA|nr:Hypothetical predicted protein [Mytilus galloprovincialis]
MEFTGFRKIAILDDQEAVTIAYKDVRDDHTDTKWLLLKYSAENKIVLHWTGSDCGKFFTKFTGKVRLFAFIRLDFEEKGPETIKRTKFVLLSWIGQDVANEKRQRVHGDRDCIKSVIKDYDCELCLYEETGIDEKLILQKVEEAETK